MSIKILASCIAFLLAVVAAGCGTEPPTVAIDTPDGSVGCLGGFRVEDETKAKFNWPGVYRIRAYDELKLELPNDDITEIENGETVFVEIEEPSKFEIHHYGSRRHVCIYESSKVEQEEHAAAIRREAREKREAEQREREREREIRAAGRAQGIDTPDGNLGCGDGFRVNDETVARFYKSGYYKIRTSKDLKLDVDGRDTEELPAGKNVVVHITRPSSFEVHNWGDAGYACIWQATESEAQAYRMKAAARAAEENSDGAIAKRCLSAWDGNHDGFERQIRQLLSDPNSMETHATYYGRIDGDFVIRMDYGARNAFGGMVRTTAVGIMNTETCEVAVIDYGFD